VTGTDPMVEWVVDGDVVVVEDAGVVASVVGVVGVAGRWSGGIVELGGGVRCEDEAAFPPHAARATPRTSTNVN
jgi:hypothetical protein